MSTIEVPPDKAPLARAQGDLLGTLTTLQEFYGILWLAGDVVAQEGDPVTLSPENYSRIAQLIATAVQQCKELPDA